MFEENFKVKYQASEEPYELYVDFVVLEVVEQAPHQTMHYNDLQTSITNINTWKRFRDFLLVAIHNKTKQYKIFENFIVKKKYLHKKIAYV